MEHDARQVGQPHWLDRYANGYHAWQHDDHSADGGGRSRFYRPLGLTESGFDNDGIYFEGRADINAALSLRVVSNELSSQGLKDRIHLAWTVLRLHHVLLLARITDKQEYMKGSALDRFFVVSPPSDAENALADSNESIVFVDDVCTGVDPVQPEELYTHAQNVARVIDVSKSTARLFVMGTGSHKATDKLDFLFVMAHCISDGLTNYTWLNHFIHLLNTSEQRLRNDLATALHPPAIRSRLPSAQEDLYPVVPGNVARRRWFWAITRILRHVRKPNPPAIGNPLRRASPRQRAVAITPRFPELFDYSRVPPLNTHSVYARIPPAEARLLQRLSRSSSVSVGAGCFALVAMTMADIHSERGIATTGIPSIVLTFPINPRPFYDHQEPPNSMMLAFSDGIDLPCIPAAAAAARPTMADDAALRFRVFARQAHRRLAMYQKRPVSLVQDRKAYMGTRGAGRVIAMTYLNSCERKWQKLPENVRRSTMPDSPQGIYEAVVHPTPATNGISSVGRLVFGAGLAGNLTDATKDTEGDGSKTGGHLKVEYLGTRQGVRARDGEFLVAIWSDEDDTLNFSVSIDGNAIDEEWTEEWKRRIEAADVLSSSEDQLSAAKL